MKLNSVAVLRNDYATLTTQLTKMNKLEEAGDIQYLMSLAEFVPSTANFNSYVSIVIDFASRRYLREKAKIVLDYTDKYSAVEITSYLKEKLENIRSISTDEYSLLSEEIEDYISYLDSPREGFLETLFPLFDDGIGLYDTALITLAGRPGSGKSALALNIVEGICRQGKHVSFLSREMSKNSLKNRLYANLANVENMKIRNKDLNDNEWTQLRTAINNSKEYKLNIIERNMTVEHLHNYCKILKQQRKLDFLVVDHALIVNTDRKFAKRNEQVNYISWKLKELAMEFNIPVLMLTQLSRSAVTNDRPPILSDLKESGGIEENSNIVLLLHNKQADDGDTESENNVVELIVGKNRDGADNNIHYYFSKPYQRFEELVKNPMDGKYYKSEKKKVIDIEL